MHSVLCYRNVARHDKHVSYFLLLSMFSIVFCFAVSCKAAACGAKHSRFGLPACLADIYVLSNAMCHNAYLILLFCTLFRFFLVVRIFAGMRRNLLVFFVVVVGHIHIIHTNAIRLENKQFPNC